MFKRLALLALLILSLLSVALQSSGEVLDEVAAFIDNQAITLSELDDNYSQARKINPGITREQVLETMINRKLLLDEARKMDLKAPDEDALLKEYTKLKVRSFILVTDNEIKSFFEDNKEQFGGKSLLEVKDQIREFLTEKEVNERLRQHIQELREKAYIKKLL